MDLKSSLDKTRRLTASLSGVTAIGNSAALGGGGAFLGSNTALTAVDSAVSGCAASRGSGGGIVALGALSAELTNVVLEGNNCSESGGGLYAASTPSVVLRNVTASGNVAGGDGAGGAFLRGTSLTVDGSRFEGNRAVGMAPRGGGVYIGNHASIFLTNSTLVRVRWSLENLSFHCAVSLALPALRCNFSSSVIRSLLLCSAATPSQRWTTSRSWGSRCARSAAGPAQTRRDSCQRVRVKGFRLNSSGFCFTFTADHSRLPRWRRRRRLHLHRIRQPHLCAPASALAAARESLCLELLSSPPSLIPPTTFPQNPHIAAALISNTTIAENLASVSGGGVSSWGPVSFVFSGCSFVRNECTLDGAALAVGINAEAELEDCAFANNAAQKGDGGVAAIFRSSRIRMVSAKEKWMISWSPLVRCPVTVTPARCPCGRGRPWSHRREQRSYMHWLR